LRSSGYMYHHSLPSMMVPASLLLWPQAIIQSEPASILA
jgi:hypothetical protein